MCHLFSKTQIVLEDVAGMDRVERFYNSSHFDREVRMCRECGQLFLFEYIEFMDFSFGKDKQYCTYIPVKDVDEARQINEKYPSNIRVCPVRPMIIWDDRIYIRR